MFDTFFNINSEELPWLSVLLTAIVATPLVLVGLNELIRHFGRRDTALVAPLRTVRDLVLPLVAGLFIVTQVFDVPRSQTVIRVLETCLWILIINAAVTIINRLFFAEGGTRRAQRVPQLFLDIFRVVVVLVGVAIVISTVWGADLGNLVTALGLGSFVIGLALQDTLGNLFSGIALVYERPFAVGDMIEVHGKKGRVVEMNWRAVRIVTRTERMIVIPHLVIGQSEITNYSQPVRYHRTELILGFSYNDPPNRVKEVLYQTCKSTPGVLDVFDPEVKTVEYNSSSIDYEVEFAIESPYHEEVIRDRFMSRIWYTAYRAGLEIPFPQHVLHRAGEVQSVESAKRSELDDALAQLPHILELDEAAIREVERQTEIRHYGRGETIVQQGDATGALYVLLSGEASVVQQTQPGGEAKEILLLSPRDFFGRVSLFEEFRSSVSIRATRDLTLVRLQPEAVRQLVRRYPAFAGQVEEMMERMPRDAFAMSTGSARGRR